jgi:hypothetical protein
MWYAYYPEGPTPGWCVLPEEPAPELGYTKVIKGRFVPDAQTLYGSVYRVVKVDNHINKIGLYQLDKPLNWECGDRVLLSKLD